jgi:hypothetical protein
MITKVWHVNKALNVHDHKRLNIFAWVWAQDKDLFKLLVSTFGLSLDTIDVDKFYLNKIRRKLKYWSITRPSLGRRVFIVHCVFLATLWCFLSIWLGFKLAIEKARSMNINYLWSRSEFLTQAWVKWIDCCPECQKEDSIMDTLLTKWIILAFQPHEFNLKILLHHRLLMRSPLNTRADC